MASDAGTDVAVVVTVVMTVELTADAAIDAATGPISKTAGLTIPLSAISAARVAKVEYRIL